MPLWVVACPRCKHAKVCNAGQKTTTCGHCGRVLQLEGLRKHLTTEDHAQAQHAAGLLNAKLSGRLDAFAEAQALVPPKEAPRTPRDRATAVRRVASELAGQGPFDARAFAAALARAGVPQEQAQEHLDRLVADGVLFEPRPGRYAAP